VASHCTHLMDLDASKVRLYIQIGELGTCKVTWQQDRSCDQGGRCARLLHTSRDCTAPLEWSIVQACACALTEVVNARHLEVCSSSCGELEGHARERCQLDSHSGGLRQLFEIKDRRVSATRRQNSYFVAQGMLHDLCVAQLSNISKQRRDTARIRFAIPLTRGTQATNAMGGQN
jgi:hypothetical protein